MNGNSYRCDIDALTGTVIEMSGPPAENAGETASGTSGSTVLTESEAKAAALAHAGLSSSQVTFISCSLERDDGRQIYNIEFYTSDYSEYDYEIDALTGAVIQYDYDAEYYTPPASGGSGTISASKAREIALAQVPGASASDIREFETDYDDGHLEYEGTIIYNGMEYEFTIDGYSGAIREWEADSL